MDQPAGPSGRGGATANAVHGRLTIIDNFRQAVAHGFRRAVVAGRDDAISLDDDGDNSSAETVRFLADRHRDSHLVLVSSHGNSPLLRLTRIRPRDRLTGLRACSEITVSGDGVSATTRPLGPFSGEIGSGPLVS